MKGAFIVTPLYRVTVILGLRVFYYLFFLPHPNGAGLKSKTTMDIHTYNREADDIDEIQKEDRQERMKKEKDKASHFRYLRHKASNAQSAANIKIAKCEVKDAT